MISSTSVLVFRVKASLYILNWLQTCVPPASATIVALSVYWDTCRVLGFVGYFVYSR